MDQFEYEEAFKPDFSKDIEERQKLFISELIYLWDNVYEHSPTIQHNQFLDYFVIDTKFNSNGEATLGFWFNKAGEEAIHYKIKENIFTILVKHFPDSHRGSLIGYPEHT